uniref:Uncharacterized protein n=1 Tax=Arundo donax TaxID=35708 RepID=A0A0A9CP07_ARUDO
MLGKLRELTATARSATRRPPATAYHHRPRRGRCLPPPAPAAAPFAAGGGSEDITLPGRKLQKQIWKDSKKFSALVLMAV